MKEIHIRNLREAEEVVRLARLLGRHGHAQAVQGGNLVEIVDRLFGYGDPQKTEFLRAARIAINELRAR